MFLLQGQPYNVQVRRIQKTINSSKKAMKKEKMHELLETGHLAEKCTVRVCKRCAERHQTLLHEDKKGKEDERKQTKTTPATPSSSSSASQVHLQNVHLQSTTTGTTNNILLATAMIKVIDARGIEHSCRTLLNSGSESDLISTNLVKRLKISINKVNISLMVVGHAHQQVNSSCDITFRATRENFRSAVSCLIVQKICNEVPPEPVKMQGFGIPDKLPLVDPTFHKPGSCRLIARSTMLLETHVHRSNQT